MKLNQKTVHQIAAWSIYWIFLLLINLLYFKDNNYPRSLVILWTILFTLSGISLFMAQILLLKIINRKKMKHKALPVYVVGLSLVSAYIWGGFEPLISWMINPAKELVYDLDINSRNTFSLTFILCFFSFLYLYNPLEGSSNMTADTDKLNGDMQEQKRVALDYNNQVVLIPVQKIRRISVRGNYTLVKDVEEKEFEAKRSLKSWEDELIPFGFIRIHRSTLVNRFMIESIKHQHNYTLRIKLQGEDAELSVSRRYATLLRKTIAEKAV